MTWLGLVLMSVVFLFLRESKRKAAATETVTYSTKGGGKIHVRTDTSPYFKTGVTFDDNASKMILR